ncbi:MAG: nucleoside monophosphate kinase [Minisyncoccia bacterium]
MDSKIKIFFLVGKPACGKDTQADFLVKRFKLKKITTSEELRKFFNRYKKKYILINGRKINVEKQRKIINSGKLVAFSLVAYIVGNIIKKAIKNRESIVFSGSPRSKYEAKISLDLVRKNNLDFYFIYLKIDDKEAIKRALLRKRKDLDVLPKIKKRLKEFREKVLPAINYLKENKVLIEVDGKGKPEDIFKRILSEIR